jgi:hypothetical protein
VAVLAMAADEEAEIARQVRDCLAGEGQAAPEGE